MPMGAKPFNFSAGPAILPEPVLERVAAAVRELRSAGIGTQQIEGRFSILEISHRGEVYESIHAKAQQLCRDVLGLHPTHRVLFLQGGASLQFGMVPLNLGEAGRPACYIDTGVWSQKAIAESRTLTDTLVVASSAAQNYDHIPEFPSAAALANASYLHITTNNTIFGTQWREIPSAHGDVPLVADLSSDIASAPMRLDRVALGYAGAQKNLGPSGVTLVFIREDLLAREGLARVPTMLRYKVHADSDSLYNTVNTFGVLVLQCVLEWIQAEGGLVEIERRNRRKADMIYAVLDGSSLYQGHAQVASRSRMNVTFTLRGKDDAEVTARTQRFVAEATAAGFHGLKGHRSVGGIRASIYNAFPEHGVAALCEFMRSFERGV